MEIWRDIIENGDSGVERLVSEYGNRLLAAATLLCRNDADAEDLVFRALERAVARIRSYRPTGSFFAWLYAILLNLYRMDLRRGRPETVPAESAEAVPDATEAAAPDRAADRAAVREAVLALPPAQRETVVLHFFAGLSVEESARALGVPPGTVKSRIFHAKAALRAALGETAAEGRTT